ncbi:MAG TPA: RNA methyltransferase, partial [Candidatus Ozemobacteraceae bacterium]|nr:RNA methyltransferase [Candidatus Ozemobacteraceae bacterium]
IREARASGLELETLLTERPAHWRQPEWADRLCELKSFLMKRLSRLETPPPDIGLFRTRRLPPLAQALRAARTVLVLDRVQDPGNLGTIIRSMEALAADLLILLPGCCSPVNDKVLRAAMGSAFRLPVAVVATDDEALKTLAEQGFTLVATAMNGTSITGCSFPEKIALILGAEGRGVRPEILAQAALQLTIPIREPVESLNVAMAATICLYERMRQRNGK